VYTVAKQTKHLIALDDVKTVVLQCNRCGSIVTYHFAYKGPIPTSCQVCGSDWCPTPSSMGFNKIIGKFLHGKWGLEKALEAKASSLGYTMSLEV
jgi:hypothetical protein